MKSKKQIELLNAIDRDNYTKIIDELVEKGVDLNTPLGSDKETALHRAASFGELEIVKYLHKQGADLNQPNKQGRVPLGSATDLRVVRYLIKQGAELHHTDKKGHDLCYFHILFHHYGVIEYLNKKRGDAVEQSEIAKIKPVKESKFWKLIDLGVKKGKNDERLVSEEVYKVLRFYSPKEIIGYAKRLFLLKNEAHISNFWAAAYLLQGGCTDDDFIDFKDWVVSLGKTAFDKSLKDPDFLLKPWQKRTENKNKTELDIGNLSDAIWQAYKTRAGVVLPTGIYTGLIQKPGRFEMDIESSIENRRKEMPKILRHSKSVSSE